MRERITVNFFHENNKSMLPDWMWQDSDGHAPGIGDSIIAPNHRKWIVISRTWQHHVLKPNELHCNIIVRDAVECAEDKEDDKRDILLSMDGS